MEKNRRANIFETCTCQQVDKAGSQRAGGGGCPGALNFFRGAQSPIASLLGALIVGFRMTSLKLKLKNYRSYRDFTFTMH